MEMCAYSICTGNAFCPVKFGIFALSESLVPAGCMEVIE